ncbi:MAG: ATP-dependent Clp protease proteolytic subunit, partial [Lachnospiraceae bacterium]|nr:ATP-dependent Clp protease proteolytic subunit [Lachnospiraceae bacterium]
ASEIEIEAEHIIRMKKKLNETLAKNTGQDLSVIERDTDRDHWLSAEEAVAYGIIDSVISAR